MFPRNFLRFLFLYTCFIVSKVPGPNILFLLSTRNHIVWGVDPTSRIFRSVSGFACKGGDETDLTLLTQSQHAATWMEIRTIPNERGPKKTWEQRVRFCLFWCELGCLYIHIYIYIYIYIYCIHIFIYIHMYTHLYIIQNTDTCIRMEPKWPLFWFERTIAWRV